jgi:hypothetical protein
VPLIKLKDAQPSDVLAADVLDSRGRLLVAKGSSTTPSILQRLAKRGVERFHVVARPGDVEDRSDAHRSAIQSAVEERFRWVAGDSFMRALKEIVLRTSLPPPEDDPETPPEEGPGTPPGGGGEGPAT